MQELELNYPTTKGKVYSEEEDRYILFRLHHYGMQAEEVYEKIKRDILEFPVFRFDWFIKSRSPQELQRRCNTLLGMIEKEAQQEAELRAQQEALSTKSKGKVSVLGIFCSSGGHLTLFFCRSVALSRCRPLTRRKSRGRQRRMALWRSALRRRRRRDPVFCFLDFFALLCYPLLSPATCYVLVSSTYIHPIRHVVHPYSYTSYCLVVK